MGLKKMAGLLMSAAAAVAAMDGTAAAQETMPPHQTFTIESHALAETRRINVYTPPGYDPAGATRFPVLYMPDGGVEEDFPHVAATVDAAIRAGEMRPMLVVGIENTERRRDMTGPTQVANDRKIAPHVGGSAAFRRFIARELMPQVRRRYRVTRETAIVGESLAGLFIVETFFLQPRLFDTYVAFSPSLWWNGGELVQKAEARLRSHPNLRNTLYMSSADEEDIVREATHLAEILRAHAPPGLHWRYHPRPDEHHNTIYHAEENPVLRSLFPPATTAVSP
ncbi:MAG: putative esterase [Gemmatimonadetes bacterium]|nr:putative esterase [Gemmatimonadota bacterium]